MNPRYNIRIFASPPRVPKSDLEVPRVTCTWRYLDMPRYIGSYSKVPIGTYDNFNTAICSSSMIQQTLDIKILRFRRKKYPYYYYY